MFTSMLIEAYDPFYDSFVKSHPNGHLSQSYHWGSLKESFGWKPIRLMIFKDNIAVGAITLLKRRWFNENCLFYAPRGPVLDFHDDSVWNFLLEKVRQLAFQENAGFLKIDPVINSTNKTLLTKLNKYGFIAINPKSPEQWIQHSMSFRIDLHTKKNLKNFWNHRLITFGLDFSSAVSDEFPKTFYSLMLEHAKTLKMRIRAYEYFNQLWKEFPKSDRQVFLVTRQGQLLAGALVFAYGKTLYCLYACSLQDEQRLNAEMSLHKFILDWATQNQFDYYELVDTLHSMKKKPDEFAWLFSNNEPFFYLGEFDLVFNQKMYRLFRILFPIYRWSQN